MPKRTLNHHMNVALLLLAGESDLPGRVTMSSSPGFGVGSGSAEGPNFVQVLGQFSFTQSGGCYRSGAPMNRPMDAAGAHAQVDSRGHIVV
jgi:hypothetical protein